MPMPDQPGSKTRLARLDYAKAILVLPWSYSGTPIDPSTELLDWCGPNG